jgi:hypothetical protein
LAKNLNEKNKKNKDEIFQKNEQLIEFNNPYAIILKEFKNLQQILIDLGLYCFKMAYINSIETLEKKLADEKEDCVHNLFKQLKDAFNKLVSHFMPDSLDDDSDNILKYSSEKVRALTDILKKEYSKTKDKAIHTIVFAERKKTVFYLDRIFKKLNQIDDYNFIKSTFVHGTSLSNAEDMMSQNKQVNRLN